MVFPPFQIFGIFLPELVEEPDDLILSIIRIGPLEWLIGFIPIDQCYIGIDAVPEIGTVRIAFGGRQDNMLQTKIARINIDTTISIGGGIFFLETIGPLFNIRKQGNEDEALEGDEAAKQEGAHLLRVIVGQIERKLLADRIYLSKVQTEVLHSLGKNTFLRNNYTHEKFCRIRLFWFSHPVRLPFSRG